MSGEQGSRRQPIRSQWRAAMGAGRAVLVRSLRQTAAILAQLRIPAKMQKALPDFMARFRRAAISKLHRHEQLVRAEAYHVTERDDVNSTPPAPNSVVEIAELEDDCEIPETPEIRDTSGGPGDEAPDAVLRRVEAAFERVPAIGATWLRWYDYPYRLILWALRGWRRRVLPRSARDRLANRLNYLSAFNDHDRHKVWDPSDKLHNFTVPVDEHVTVPALWVVELFPPSELAALASALLRHGWDRQRERSGEWDTNKTILARSRAGVGSAWWQVATVVSVDAKWAMPNATRARLPPMFRSVNIAATQLGRGLTAVTAQFWLTEEASRSVDESWHTPHEPQLVRQRGKRPRAEDRSFAAYRLTQEARIRFHDAARSWMSQTLPGFFSAASEPHPLLEMLLMEKFDPTAGIAPTWDESCSLRALGLSAEEPYERVLPDVPGMLLASSNVQISPALKTDRTWCIWGRSEVVSERATHLDMFGGRGPDAIANRFSMSLSGLLVLLSVSDFLEVIERRYAELRDSARVIHGRFGPKSLEGLRQQLLTVSLDLAAVRRDMSSDVPFHLWDEAQVFVHKRFAVRNRKKRETLDPSKAESFNRALRRQQESALKRLSDIDRDYREILSTVASLGSSADSSKISRRALLVSGASVVVASVTLLVTNLGSDTTFSRIVEWLTG